MIIFSSEETVVGQVHLSISGPQDALVSLDTTNLPTSIESRIGRPTVSLRALGWLIFRIDDRLRVRHRVYEFSHSRKNIFRMQVREFDQDVVLRDRAHAIAGDRIIDLHIWNEHLPVICGGSLRWARHMHECLHASLCDLADYLGTADNLDEVNIIRANMGFGTRAQTQQLVRISSRYGFEPVQDLRAETVSQRLHRFGENVLISLMVLARNGAALRTDSLNRSRVQVFLSRRALMDRYARQSRLECAGRET